MFPARRILFAALALALLFSSAAPALAQGDAAQTPKPADDSISEKGFRGRIFELKHRNPDTIYGVIRPLGSGFKGASFAVNREMMTITVRDFPENLAVIEEAIKRLDTPEPSRPDIEFHVHILIATNTPQRAAGTADLPSELNDVVKQLQTTLSYKSYYLMNSQVLRGKEGPAGLGNKGVAEFKLLPGTAASENPIFYDYRIDQVSLEGAAGSWKVQINRFGFGMRIPIQTNPGVLQYENIGFNTPVGLREGEKVVVGTTSMQDKGIVIVIVANVIK